MSDSSSVHYLEEELFKLIKKDNSIFDFIQSKLLDGLWYWDLEKPENEWMNARFWTTLGYKSEDMPHSPDAWQDIINEEDLKSALDNFNKHIENPAHPYDQIVRYRHQDGSVVWIRCYGMAIRDENGKPVRMLGAHIDITEMKEQELQLTEEKKRAEESDAKFRTLFTDSKAVQLLIDPVTGCISDANKAACEFYGYAYEALCRKKIQDINKYSDERVRLEMQKARERKVNYFEFQHRLADGSVKEVEVYCNPIKIGGKQMLISIVHDNSYRKKAEKELKAAKAQAEAAHRLLENVTRNMIDMVAISDKNGIFRYVSESHRNIGYSPHELIGKNMFDYVHPKDIERIKAIFADFIGKPYEKKAQLRFRTADGDYFWIETFGKPLENDHYLYSSRDISLTKENEKRMLEIQMRLKESETRFKALHNASFGGIAIHDKGIILDCNKGMAKMTGYSHEELIGMNGLLLIAENKRDYVMSRITEGYEKPYEAVGLRKNGEEYPLRLEARNIPYKGRHVRSVEFRDISQQKKYEAEIIKAKEEAEENEAKFKSYIENAPDGIVVFNLRGNIIDLNSRMADMLGYGKDELLAMQKPLSVPDNEVSKAQDAVLELLQTGKSKKEMTLKRKDGSLFHALVSAVKVSERKTLMFVKDINNILKARHELWLAKEKAEENNRVNKVRLELIQYGETHSVDELLEEALNRAEEISHSRIGFFHFITPDQQTAELQVWSTATKRCFCNMPQAPRQYTLEESGVWVDCVKAGKPVIHNNYEALPHKKGLPEGHAKLVRELLIPIIYQGKVKAIIGVGNKEEDYNESDVENVSLIAYFAWEIVEKKRINNALIEAKDKAEESNRLKTEFINNMSHEIRTPMNGILGFSSLLSDENLSPENRRHYIDIIQNSGEQLMRIINDILEISELETKQIKAYEEPVCINEFLLRQFSVFDMKAKEIGVPLYIKRTLSDKASTVLTDESKLNKIISNLLENALKFTHRGFVEIGSGIHESEGRKWLELYAKDTGIGFRPESREMIFERFSQEEKDISKSVGGLGLGLAIAKENAEILGGTIIPESEKGKGATFRLYIPYKPHKQALSSQTAQKQLEPETENRQFTVLIVEDEEVNFLYLDILITEQSNGKYRTVHARNGIEAVDYCGAHESPDVVLMDLRMPEMDGFEATRLLKAQFPDIPVIVQTAYISKEDKAKAFENGCDELIAKPIDAKVLFELMRKYIQVSD